MMQFGQTESGGRFARGRSPYGQYYVEWDSDGILVSESIDISEPQAPRDKLASPPVRTKTSHRYIGPGTSLEHLIRIATLGRVKPCKKCQCRKRTMDKWGWWGLIKRLCTLNVGFDCEGCKAKERVRKRAATCAQCEHMQAIEATRVECELKGMIDFKDGTCPDNRW